MTTWTYDLKWACDKYLDEWFLEHKGLAAICENWAFSLFGADADKNKTIRATLSSVDNGGLHVSFAQRCLEPTVDGAPVNMYG